MTTPLLVIGNKNYSSWSLRAWLLLKSFDITFNETLIQLFDPASKPTLQQYSPNGKVPILVIDSKLVIGSNQTQETDNALNISDSLAIALYNNDYLTDKDIWSGKLKSALNSNDFKLQRARVFCQSIVAEMHSGFMGVRRDMPMNIRATAKIQPSAAALQDLARIEHIFEICLSTNKNSKLSANQSSEHGYLFGDFTIADAWYAPVVFRLNTYAEASGLRLKSTTLRYIDTVLGNADVQAWQNAALLEKRILPEDESGDIIKVSGVLANSSTNL